MKKILFGILIGVAISVPSTIFADEVASLIGKKVDGEFIISLNDKELSTKAIVIEGTSYVPVRSVGESLGLDVGFNPTGGITLKNKGGGNLSLPNLTSVQDRQKRTLKLYDLKKEIDSLTSQISELYKIIEPYEKFSFTQGQGTVVKEKDDLYYTTTDKRNKLIADRSVLEKQVEDLNKEFEADLANQMDELRNKLNQ